jgi:uncharacterized coiled-coil protein SlyX
MKALIETIIERPDPSLGGPRPAWNRRKRRQQIFFAVPPERSLRFLCCLLLSLALLPKTHAVVPAPDGGYPNFTTAEGTNSLKNLTTGVGNTAVGWSSLLSDTDGSYNTAVGAGTLLLNVGNQSTSEGTENTAVGAAALLLNTTGLGNTAVGATALLNNSTGRVNTAVGVSAIFSNTTGGNNTAVGTTALGNNTEGDGNVAVGTLALSGNTTGSNNIALGGAAGVNITTGSNNIDIGNTGAAESNTIRIGFPSLQNATYIAGITGQTVGTGGIPVYVDNQGKLGVMTSSRRFKENVHRMDDASAALFSLKPVTFRYKREFDSSGTPQFGLIAEEVEKINPALVTRDAKGDINTVRYEAVNAMLLNEFLKEHKKVEIQARKLDDQEARIAQQQKQIETLAATVKEQSAQIQKVSAKIEARNAVVQTAFNDR